MPRQINKDRDQEVLEYLRTHSFTQTAEKFGISKMTVNRIKKRAKTTSKPEHNNNVTDSVTKKLPITLPKLSPPGGPKKRINVNKALKKLKSLKVEDYPAYDWIIGRSKTRKHPMVQSFHFANEFWEEIAE